VGIIKDMPRIIIPSHVGEQRMHLDAERWPKGFEW
jgi:hypothetical protein